MESIASNYTANEGDSTDIFNRRTKFYEQNFMDIFVNRVSIPFLQGYRAETGGGQATITFNHGNTQSNDNATTAEKWGGAQ